ncbi:GRB2-associated-binding protein 1 [Channa argus]|uniref:GRB2-associated-binding protein 1 n=1 Tax=Channa argus TaxID=215402 RepID=A0A6G1Q683_CHAAH|nr:GRB2-associated-binding protein 1 [Channa argus]
MVEMPMNSSTSSGDSRLLEVYCYMVKPFSSVFTAYAIIKNLILLPLCILVLYHGLQRWRQQRWSSTASTMTHSESFTYHLVTMELISVFGCIICCCGVYGPGERGREREKVDQSKLRAFYTIEAILGVQLLRFAWNLALAVFYLLNVSTGECVVSMSEIWVVIADSSIGLSLCLCHIVGINANDIFKYFVKLVAPVRAWSSTVVSSSGGNSVPPPQHQQAWKRRWFVLRSGRLTGEPDVLQYYKNQQSRRPIGTINLNLCEQVDAGLSFTKKELESSFVFDLRTEERIWYLVAESEEDMNRWVSAICLLCGFNPTDEVPETPPVSGSAPVTVMPPTNGIGTITTVTGSVPPPYDPVSVQPLEADSNAGEEDYMWLSHCQSHIRPSLGSSTSLETDDNLYPPPSATSSSSSSSSSPSLFSNRGSAPWTVASMTGPLSQSLDASVTSDFQNRGGKPRCHPSPHPRKHSLDFHLRPVAKPFTDDTHSTVQPSAYLQNTSYQIPRPASNVQPRPPRRPSSTPSVDSLTPAEVHASTPTPPPRPPKPPVIVGQVESSAVGTEPATLPRSTSEPEKWDGYEEGGAGLPKSNAVTMPGRTQTVCESFYIPRSLSDRASLFEFSESFNNYFFNKGMVPLGSVCSEDDDVDENYVPMSAATTEPPVAPRVPPTLPSDPFVHIQDGNYVPMTPVTPSLTTHPTTVTSDLASLGRQVPPPAHMGFRNPLTPITRLTPPLRRNAIINASVAELEALPPPIHRNLKPQRRAYS